MRHHFTSLVAWSLTLCGSAQLVAPRGLVPAGGSSSYPSGSFEWSLGQPVSATFEGGTPVITSGILQPEGVRVALNVRVLLAGPYVPAVSLMLDSLRSKGLVPATEPYTSSGYQHTGAGGGEQLGQGVLAATGPDAIVDWVVMELRAAADMANVVGSRSALVQRDGDVVDTDGTTSVRFMVPPGSYHVLVRHRNHLPVMTASPHALSPVPVAIDLTDGTVTVYGTDAQRVENGIRMLWPGNVIPDGLVRYSGQFNDRDPILQAIGGSVPTATATGYMPEDVNLDGTVKYTGPANDRDLILQTIGGAVPTATRAAQVP
ncbi:MAG: hypothetical protein JNM31_12970 [Flavobacteriales bacterium]|nr:hypothetical protein [Flavobacteriales bacterium]